MDVLLLDLVKVFDKVNTFEMPSHMESREAATDREAGA
jgi:hypothetical protein